MAVTGLLLFSSCSDSSTGSEPVSEIQVEMIEDLHAPSSRENPDARFVFFSLRTGQIVDAADSASTDWDIAFKGTEIIVNSGVSGPGGAGAVVLDMPFEEVEIAPETGYQADSEGAKAISDWYNYTGEMGNPKHAVIPLEKTIVVKTGDGQHYAKIDIMSYYEGNPDTSTEEFANFMTRPASPFFTFQYAIQLEEGLRDLQ